MTEKKFSSYTLAFGDSITAGYCRGGLLFHPPGDTLEKLMTERGLSQGVITSGVPGELTDSMVQRLPVVLKQMNVVPERAVLCGGLNDMGSGRDGKIVPNLIKMTQYLQEQGVGSVFITTVPTCRGDALWESYQARKSNINKALSKQVALLPDVYLVDLSPQLDATQLSEEDIERLWDRDGLHYSPQGSDVMASLIDHAFYTSSQDR